MMPFTYRFNLPSLPEVEGTIVFQEWIAANRAHVLPGTPVALIAVSGKRYRILANGDAYLWEKLVKPGEALKPGHLLGNMAADGENIPYGKPHSLAELMPEET